VEQSSVLRKVRALVSLAEHPSTPPEEATAARRQADRLMLAFAVDEAALDESRPEVERSKPEILDIELAGQWGDVLYEVAQVASMVAQFCRCKLRNYTQYADGVYHSTVYGFAGDLRYFEMLYSALRLHMVAVLIPTWDENVSLEENCYRLHSAGLNWMEIAKMRGWTKVANWLYPGIKNPYEHKDVEDVLPSNTVGGVFKLAYLRACKDHGTRPIQIPAAGSATWRRCATDGYTSRIGQRLRAARTSNKDEGTGTGLVLRSESLDAFYKDQNPDLYPDPKPEPEPEADPPAKPRKARRVKAYKPPPFNPAAYQSGSDHADTADISGPRVARERDAVGSSRKGLDS
jgi:hypothetical protein